MKISRRQALWGTLGMGIGVAGFLGIKKIYKVYATPHWDVLESKREDLNALVEAIIPAGAQNPGAQETGTTQFVLLAVRKCAEVKTQNNFISGLTEMASLAKDRFDKSLSNCSIEQRIELLTQIETEAESLHVWTKKAKRLLWGDEFIFTLKRFTVWGYCTSELGATTGLNYDYIPGKFVGDVHLNPGQKSWATS